MTQNEAACFCLTASLHVMANKKLDVFTEKQAVLNAACFLFR